MAFALARTRALLGLEAPLVSVEVHLSGGPAPHFPGGSPGRGGAREQGPGPSRARGVGLPVSERARRHQSRSGRPAEGGRPVRPAHRARHPGRFRTASGGAARRGGGGRRAVPERDGAAGTGRGFVRGRGPRVRPGPHPARRQRPGSRLCARGEPLPGLPPRGGALPPAGGPRDRAVLRPAAGIATEGVAGPGGRSGTGDGQARPRSRRGRRSPRPHGRPARHREDHARLPPSGSPSADARIRGRSRPWPSTPPDAWSATPPRGGRDPSGRRTTRPPRSGWRGEACRPGRARSRWPTTDCCSSTSSASSAARSSTCCANRSNRAGSPSSGPPARRCSRLDSSSWRP